MPTTQAYDLEARFKNNFATHTRAESIASSSGSSSSADSAYQPSPAFAQSTPPRRKKSSSFSRIFGVKEPSLNALEQLAEIQQKELAQKNQKIPFGVPSAKLPQSAREDYKRAKQRAKESAKMHEAIKQKLRQQGDDDRRRYEEEASIRELSARDKEQSMRFDSTSPIAMSPNAKDLKKFVSSTPSSTPVLRQPPSIDLLPETPPEAAVISHRGPKAIAPSPPKSHRAGTHSPPKINGVLRGSARKEALPWE